MQPKQILDIWDTCISKDQLFKGATLATLAFPQSEFSTIMEWSIDKRDTVLFHIRRALFGNQFTNIAHCPQCSQKLEWEFSYQQLQIPSILDIKDNVEIPLNITGTKMLVRLPTSIDVKLNNENEILNNCILNHSDLKDKINANKLPDFNTKINDAFAANCHASNISYQLQCVDCSHNWQGIFDILSYLWKEIDQWAKGFLQQISLLAKNYGWSELEIINMSQNRRNHYLQLINI